MTEKNWRLISIVDLNDGQDFNNPCNADNIYTFTLGNKLYTHVGGDNCGDTESSSAVNWSFSADEKMISISGNDFVVSKLTEDSLVYKAI